MDAFARDICPDASELRAFARGEPSTHSLDAIANHVANCVRCQARLDEVSPDSMMRHIRDLGDSGEVKDTDVVGEGPSPSDETITIVPSDRPEPSAQTIGRYQLQGELGKGGMGVVYKAYDPKLKRIVALKMIKEEMASAAVFSRFQAEAEAVARLNHPNIVRIHEQGKFNGQPYCALEYVSGGSLDRRIKNTLPDPRTAARLLIPIAHGMQEAHSLNLVHRDLKPANILLAGESGAPLDACVPKIADFGLAKFLDADQGGMTVPHAVMGTPSYMAPEQAEGRTADISPATDIWALGAVLYDLLTGRPPFKGTTDRETLMQVSEREPASVRHLQSKVPRDLETICLKCLQKSPGKRYSSAAELANDLQRFLNGESITARPVSRPEKLWRWSKRKPAMAALASFSIVTAISLLVGAILFIDTRRANELHEAKAKADRAGRESADLKQKAAEDEKRTAEEQRNTSDYFHRLTLARERIALRDTGWTWRAFDDVSTAAAIATPARNATDLRSAMVSCLAGVDVRVAQVLKPNMEVAAVKFHPNGKWLILAQDQAPGMSRDVLIIDRAKGETVRRLTYPTAKVPKDRPEHTRCLAISPDGNWLVLGTRSGRLHRWDLRGDRVDSITWSPEPDAEVTECNSVEFAPDGSALYVLTQINLPNVTPDSCVSRWPTDCWKKTGAFSTKEGGSDDGVTVHPHGSFVYCTGSRNYMNILDAITLEKVDEITEGAGPRAIAGDGRLFAINNSRSLSMWEPHRRSRTNTFRMPLREFAYENHASWLQFSPDGRLIAAGFEHDQHLIVYDVATGERVVDWRAPEGRARFSFDPSSRMIAVAGKNETTLLEIGGQCEHRIVAPQPYDLKTASLSPDGRQLALLAGNAHNRGWQERWSLDAQDTREPFWVEGDLHQKDGSISFSANNNEMISAGGKDLRAFNLLRNPDEVNRLVHGDLRKAALGPDGRIWMIAADQVLVTGSLSTGIEYEWKNAEGNLVRLAELKSLAVGRKHAVTGGLDGSARIFSTTIPENATALPEPKSVLIKDRISLPAAAIAPDDSIALIGTDRGEGVIVSLPEGKVLTRWDAHRDTINTALVLPSGLMVTGGRDQTVRFWSWDGKKVNELWTIRTSSSVLSLSSSSDGHKLSVVCDGERGVHIWDLAALNARFKALGIAVEAPASWSVPRLPIPVPAPTIPDESTWPVNGLRMEMFADGHLQSLRLIQHDPHVYHNWGFAPPHPHLPRKFSVRWTGYIRPPSPGKYRFRLDGWNGWSLWLDGKQMANEWEAQRVERRPEFEVELDDRPHELRIELNHGYQSLGYLKFLWSKPGSFPEQPVSRSFLFHNKAAATAAKVPTDPKSADELLRQSIPGVRHFVRVGVSPDGRFVAAGAIDGGAYVWDTSTGKLLATLPNAHDPADGFNSVSISAGGKWLLTSGGSKGGFAVWEVATGKLMGRNNFTMDQTQAEFAPDGKTFVTTSRDGGLHWDTATVAIKATAKLDFLPRSIRWTEDGQAVYLTGLDAGAARWDVWAGRQSRFPTRGAGAEGLAISPKLGAFFQQHYPTEYVRSVLRLLDLSTGVERWSVRFEDKSKYLAISPDERLVAVAVDDDALSNFGPAAAKNIPIRLYDMSTGREVGRLVGHVDIVRGLCFSPDGKTLYSAAHDGTVRSWRVPPISP